MILIPAQKPQCKRISCKGQVAAEIPEGAVAAGPALLELGLTRGAKARLR